MDALVLGPPDLLHGERPGEERVLAEVLVVAAAVRVADEVRRRAEEHLVGEEPRLLTEDGAVLVVELAVEGRGGRRGRRDTGGQRVLAGAAADAGAAVGHPEGRDAELRDPDDGALGELQDALLELRVLLDLADRDLLDLLLETHHLEQHRRPLLGRQVRVVPRQVVGGGRCRQHPDAQRDRQRGVQGPPEPFVLCHHRLHRLVTRNVSHAPWSWRGQIPFRSGGDAEAPGGCRVPSSAAAPGVANLPV